MENERKCGDCRYFSQYYVKFDCRFMPVNRGKCKLKRVGRNFCSTDNPACNKWENGEVLQKERKEAINDAIINISKKLNEIYSVLTEKE